MPPIVPFVNMTTDFDAITAKIIRAREHLEAFRLESIEYFKNSGPIFDVRIDLDVQRVFVRYSVEKEPPHRLSILVGDCVHNLRSALDNLVCALVRISTPSSSCSGRKYPAYLTGAEYLAARNAVLRGVPEDAKVLIDKYQPCATEGTDPALHAVAILNRLSNQDKHRAPHLTAAYSRDSMFVVRYESGREWTLKLEGPMYGGTERSLPFFRPLVLHPDKLAARGNMFMAFNDRTLIGGDSPVDDVLGFCVDFVQYEIVPSFRPFLA